MDADERRSRRERDEVRRAKQDHDLIERMRKTIFEFHMRKVVLYVRYERNFEQLLGLLRCRQFVLIHSWGIEMKNWTALLLVAVALTSTGFAQRGGGHGNMGGGSMGAGSMGAGTGRGDMGTSMPSNSHANGQPGTPQPSRSMTNQSPDTALTKSPKMSSNLEKLLPSGMTAQQACSGFKNLGQCVAAIHVSHNLDIPFADLKDKMSGSNSESLGKAIQTLKPNVNAKAEAKKANKQAKQDLSENNS